MELYLHYRIRLDGVVIKHRGNFTLPFIPALRAKNISAFCPQSVFV
jgi:hypothetical protein